MLIARPHRTAPAPRRIKLARAHQRMVHASVIALFISGAAWLLLHYFGQVAGRFGTETNPLEPWTLRIHGAFSALSLMLIGSLLPIHVVPALSGRRHMVSGLSMLSIWIVLIFSGYLLYYASGEGFRAATSLVHWIVGLLLLPSLLIHLQRPRSRNTRRTDA